MCLVQACARTAESCSNPAVKPLRSVPPGKKGRHSQEGGHATACPSRDRLGAPQHSKGLIQAGHQHGSKAGWVLQQLFLIRNYQLFLIRS